MTRIRQYQRDTHIAALTRERERVKPVIEALEFIEMNYGDHDAVRDKIRQTLNNYNQNKEA